MRSEMPGADTRAFVQAALQRLRTGGYSYTLDPGVYGDDTADEFWFDRKTGFCEHISSSFVVLMRALGIPARIVTGYQGGELNGVDGYWVLRQSDAHAWAEVTWQEGNGWVRVDPTGAVSPDRVGSFSRLAAQPGFLAEAFGTVSPTLAQDLRAAWDAVNNGWNQWVLNYTQSRQLDLLKNLGFEAPSLQDLAIVLIWLVVVVSVGGAGWTLWERSQHDPWLRLLGKNAAARALRSRKARPGRRRAAAPDGRQGDGTVRTARPGRARLAAAAGGAATMGAAPYHQACFAVAHASSGLAVAGQLDETNRRGS